MPRKPRDCRECNYYHVVARGVNKMALFEWDEDYRYYLRIVEKYSIESQVAVIAYCLMHNHVHLILRDDAGNLSKFMQKTGVSYAYYFNKRYERHGHLFQNRFWSEAIRTETHLLSVLSYVLNNPLKAGICNADQYSWGSYHCYNREGWVDTSLIVELLGDEKCFRDFIQSQTDLKLPEGEPAVAISDEKASEMIRELTGFETGHQICNLSKKERTAVLRKIKPLGLSVHQIARITGLNRRTISAALR